MSRRKKSDVDERILCQVCGPIRAQPSEWDRPAIDIIREHVEREHGTVSFHLRLKSDDLETPEVEG